MHMIARGMSETIAVFLLPVTQDMNWSRTEFTTIYAVFMITHGVTAPLAGALSDRLGAGFVYKLALTILAGGFFLASQ
ncbi:MAG TPA: MFS transporter, partial [Alphaproteobacteria bacterium]|nr:MFS transporter [Alphaproteobacteria bacterium]